MSNQPTPAGSTGQQPKAKGKPRGRAASWEALLKAASAVAFLLSVFFAWRSYEAEGAKQAYERAFQNYLALRGLSHQHAVIAITTNSPDDYRTAATVASDAVATMVLQPGILKEPRAANRKDEEFAAKVMELFRLKDVASLAKVLSLSAYRDYFAKLGILERDLSKYFAEKLFEQRDRSENSQAAFLVAQAFGFLTLVLGELLSTYRSATDGRAMHD